jgi:hypothetical protein
MTLAELADPFGHDVDEFLLIGDDLGRFFEELALHTRRFNAPSGCRLGQLRERNNHWAKRFLLAGGNAPSLKTNGRAREARQ